MPHNKAAAYFGTSCHLTYSLPHEIILLHNFDSYVDAVRANINAGGDNCGRSSMIGAMYAAIYGQGEKGLPQEWVDKLTKKEEIESLMAEIDFQ